MTCKEFKLIKSFYAQQASFSGTFLGNTKPATFIVSERYSDPRALAFIYLGRTEAAQDDPNKFMDAATTLQVEGLIPRQKENNHLRPELTNLIHEPNFKVIGLSVNSVKT